MSGDNQPQQQQKLTVQQLKVEQLNMNYEARRLEDKLDKMIGFYWWKTYCATTLWANVSTPINLTITICTALMTAHSSSSDTSFISNEMNMKINLLTFLLSIINSYFTPQKELNELNEYLSRWSDIGNQFEKVIYTNNTLEQKIKLYTQLLDLANELHKDQFLRKRNFLTDFIHSTVRTLMMNSNDRWMKSGIFEFYEKIEECFELDFDLEQFKKNSKKTGIWHTFCGCFDFVFDCCRRQKPNKKVSIQSTSVNKQASPTNQSNTSSTPATKVVQEDDSKNQSTVTSPEEIELTSTPKRHLRHTSHKFSFDSIDEDEDEKTLSTIQVNE